MVRNSKECTGVIRIVPRHGDVIALTDDVKAKPLKRFHIVADWGVNGELRH